MNEDATLCLLQKGVFQSSLRRSKGKESLRRGMGVFSGYLKGERLISRLFLVTIGLREVKVFGEMGVE